MPDCGWKYTESAFEGIYRKQEEDLKFHLWNFITSSETFGYCTWYLQFETGDFTVAGVPAFKWQTVTDPQHVVSY